MTNLDKYKKLASNTIIFAIGTFSSKAMTFLMLPLITRMLDLKEYNSADLIQQSVNLILPLVTLAVNSAALRFALDKAADKKSVFSTGIYTTLGGFVVFLLFSPLVMQIKIKDFDMGNYIVLIYLFLLVSSIRQLCQQFVRGIGKVRIYAVDGIIATATTLGFSFLYLYVFHMGVNGYILAIVTSDFLSICFMFVTARLWRYLTVRKLDKSLGVQMLRYSVPLVPTVVLWWIMNVSDRYMVTYFDGGEWAGLYAAASKIPNFVVLFSSIFIDAWQLSAVDEYDNENRGSFFSKVFGVYSGGIFTVASVLILACQIFTVVLVDKSYYESWKFVPILVIATTYSCLVNFLASVYMAEKKSTMAFATAMIGAVTNVVLNLFLIPKFGPNGAAFATAASFAIVFVARAVNTRKYVKFDIQLWRLLLCTALLILQSFLLIRYANYWVYFVELLLTIVMALINIKPIIEVVNKLRRRMIRKKK